MRAGPRKRFSSETSFGRYFTPVALSRSHDSDVFERKKRSATFTSEASHGGCVRRVAVFENDDERAKTSRRRVPRETDESGEDSSEPNVGERSASSGKNERRRA